MTTRMEVKMRGDRAELQFLAIEAGHDPSRFGRATAASPDLFISSAVCRRCSTTFQVEVSADGRDASFVEPSRCPASN